MRKLLSKILSILARCSALASFGVVLWYIFGDLTNPLPRQFLGGFGEFAPFARWPFGLVFYMATGIFCSFVFYASARIVLVGWSQFIVEERASRPYRHTGKRL